MTILATKGRSAIEKRKQEALSKVKRESPVTVDQDQLKSVPDRTQHLRAMIAKKVPLHCHLFLGLTHSSLPASPPLQDETIASYLKELTELQVEHARFTEDLRCAETYQAALFSCQIRAFLLTPQRNAV